MQHDSISFIKVLYGDGHTDHDIELRAFPNTRGEGHPKNLWTRKPGEIQTFIKRNNKNGWGVFFGVATRETGSAKGTRQFCRELPAVFIDIDCLETGIDQGEALNALETCPHPPSVVVESGGGLHAYWRLTESLDVSDVGGENEREALAVMRQLVGVFAGDGVCVDIARVLRMPGTVNSKRDNPVDVRVLAMGGYDYELSDLADWLSVQRRLLEPQIHQVDNSQGAMADPYLEAARRAGFKPPMDVEGALNAMRLGGGENGVHSTQLRVSMSLVRAGKSEDEIVDLLLGATEACAGMEGRSWNWRREESAIRGMVRDAVKKIPAAAKVVQLDDHRGETTRENPEDQESADSEDKKANWIAEAAQGVMDVWSDKRGPLLWKEGSFWGYHDGFWSMFTLDDEADLLNHCQRMCEAMGKMPNPSNKRNIFEYIKHHQDVIRDAAKLEWNWSGKVVCNNVAVDPFTLETVKASPELYANYAVACDYDEDATCPIWLEFLDSAFSNIADLDERAAVIQVIKEWFGAALVRNKSNRDYKKGLFVQGGARCGKTQIAKVLGELFGGDDRVCAASVKSVSRQFGMEAIVGKSAWIADDAIGQTDRLEAERFKVIVTGERVDVERKNKINLSVRLDVPVLLTANHMPRVRDTSQAVYDRCIVLPMRHAWPKDAPKPHGDGDIADVIVKHELAGVLNWALDGWADLSERGYFDLPRYLVDAVDSFEVDNNPMRAFCSECVELSDGMKVSQKDIVASFQVWLRTEWEDEEGRNWRSRTINDQFRDVMNFTTKHNMQRTNGERFYLGVILTSDGIQFADEAARFDDINDSNRKGDLKNIFESTQNH